MNVALGLVVQRWWAVAVALPVAIVAGAASPGSEDISDTGTKIAFALIFWLPSAAGLIALGVAARKLAARRLPRARA